MITLRSLPPLLLVAIALLAVSCSPAPAGPGAGAGTEQPSASNSAPQLSATEAPSVAGARVTAPVDIPVPTVIPAPAPTEVPTAAPSLDLQKVKPNELGTVPILEYHVIADAEEDQWTRTPENFRQDLQRLYDAGYRPISMADLLDGRIDLPAGTSPVLLTFDDSSPGQFRFLERGGQRVVDPNSALGILEEFHASHLDWPLKGVFYVLPEAEQPHKLFGQPQYEAQKLSYLVDRGFEIGNHTWWHERLDEVDDQEVQRQLALAVKSIQQAVPNYRVRSMALPLGVWPENRALAFEGSFEGNSYRNESVLLVGSEPAPSPYSSGFDPRALPRVQSFADNLERWISYLAKNADERYVSDGDPGTVSFPQRLAPLLDRQSVGNRTVRSY